jgi:TatD DNase family protein
MSNPKKPFSSGKVQYVARSNNPGSTTNNPANNNQNNAGHQPANNHRGGHHAPRGHRGGHHGGHRGGHHNNGPRTNNNDFQIPVPDREWSTIDIGLNLASDHFDKDRVEVIERAKQAGVDIMILTGSSIKSSEQTFHLAKQHPGVLYSTAGIHPHTAKSCNDQTIPFLRKLLSNKEVVAVGECGLDFDRDFSPRDVQEKWFEEQLKLAVETKKPLFLHERDAHERFVAIMKQYKDKVGKAVVHCFTGTEKELDTYLDMGLYIGITGWVCDERRGLELQRIVKKIPLNRLMIETDAPYLTPRNMPRFNKVRRNEAMLLPFVVKKLAECMDISEEEIAKQTTATAREFFGLDALESENKTTAAASNTNASAAEKK